MLHQAGISSISTHTRFLQILRYLHLADNSTAPQVGTEGYDKLYRVRDFLNIVSQNVSREYKLAHEISINETMVPHKGKLSFKPYIKRKPTKWGIKLWVSSDASIDYIYKFQVYHVKEGAGLEINGNPLTNS